MKEWEALRDGIFSLRTRRFGSVAEILIKLLHNFDWGDDLAHDLKNKEQKERIEVKFSTAQKESKLKITEENVLQCILEATDEERMFKSSEWEKNPFDCNIQQVKPKEFDILYYGIFFSDKVVIFKILPNQLDKAINYSDKQHRGNKGEGQFHLNNDTYKYHLDNFKEAELTYEEILDILKRTNTLDKVDKKLFSLFSALILL